MIIKGKVVAKIQQEGGASFARIQVFKNKKNMAAFMRLFDVPDSGELNIGDQVNVEIYRPVIQQYEPPFESVPGCMFHSVPEPEFVPGLKPSHGWVSVRINGVPLDPKELEKLNGK